jgi:hemerythrin-like domain-containing protein
MDGAEAEFGAVGLDLLADPCAFLLAEHARQRALLGHLERLARGQSGPAQAAIARGLAAWFACELPLHMADEAESLMPRLAAAAPALARRLDAEDEALHALRERVREALGRIALGRPPPADFAAQALAFVALYRQHVIVEETEVLPLARRVLDAAGFASIAAEMRRRRS